MNVSKRFAENLAGCRKRLGLSKEETSVRAALCPAAVADLERGERVPRVDTLLRLAGALGVEPSELLDGLSWEPGRTIIDRSIETEVPGLGSVHRRFQVERRR